MTMMMLGLWCELKQEREQSEREGEIGSLEHETM